MDENKLGPCMDDVVTEEEAEFQALQEEIKDAHDKLTEYGIGKEHWSLAGRIEIVLMWHEMKMFRPKDGQDILIWSKGKFVRQIRYWAGNHNAYFFTHWKPLPNPPTGE